MSKEKSCVSPTLMKVNKAGQATRIMPEGAERERVASEAQIAKLKALHVARDAEAALSAPFIPSPKKGER